MSANNLKAALAQLPDNALEAIVNQQLVAPYLLNAIGFAASEVYPGYNTGAGYAD